MGSLSGTCMVLWYVCVCLVSDDICMWWIASFAMWALYIKPDQGPYV
jgi:hypothetical protein